MPLICAEIHSCLQTTEKLPHPPKKFSATPFFHSYIFSTTSLVWRLLNSSFALSQRTLASNSWDLMYMFVFNTIFALFYRSQRAAGQWQVLAYFWSSLFAPWLLPHLGFGPLIPLSQGSSIIIIAVIITIVFQWTHLGFSPLIPLSQGLLYHHHHCHHCHRRCHHHPHHLSMASSTPWLLPSFEIDPSTFQPRLVLSYVSTI